MMQSREKHPISAFCDSHGLLLRRDAVKLGIDDNALRRLVDAKALVRLRQGAYCLRSTFMAADEAERGRLLCRAVFLQYNAERDLNSVLSHTSSCLIQGGPELGLDLGAAHLTHLVNQDGRRQESRIVHHVGALTACDVRRQGDLWVTVPARAVLETACIDGPDAGLVQANFFLHRGEIVLEELLEMAQRGRHWPGSLSHHLVTHLADRRLESVGETLSDLLFFRVGLPRPTPQFEVCFPGGPVAARCDFAWPELRVIVEFDGREKYHRFRREGETIEQMVEREKKREDLIRELTGWTVIRLVWADLQTPQRTAARIRRAMSRAAA